MRDAITLLQHRADLRLSSMPTRDQLLAEAQRMFAKTISLDDIVDRAHELLNETVGFLLAAPAPAPALATNAQPGTNGGA